MELSSPWLTDEESEWLLHAPVVDGLGMIYRVRTDVKPRRLAKEYPFAVTLTWIFDGRRTHGIPSKSAEAKIDRCQDACEMILESSFEAVSVAVHTGHGKVVSLWYAKTLNIAQGIISSEAAKYPEIEHTVAVDRDDKWLRYKASLKLARGV